MRTILFVAFLSLSLSVIGCDNNASKPALRNVAPIAADANASKPDTPLPDRAYKAELSLPEPLTTFKPGQKQTIRVRVKNASDTLWIVYGSGAGNKYRVAVAD